MKPGAAISKHNFKALLWHAGFLAFASNFIDVDTVIPAMLADAGGSAVQIGILTAIMLGGSSFTQLIFAPIISNFPYKKKFLISGITTRISSLLFLGLMLRYSSLIEANQQVLLIFLLITLFSVGGAFANVSYTDILGKSILDSARKPFFSAKQVISASVLLGSAFLARHILGSADYPVNYSRMFLIGFLALSIASLGFWGIRERIPSELKVRSPRHFFVLIRREMKQNPRLSWFLGFINTMGIAPALLPFMILYSREDMAAGWGINTGTLLLLKVLGSVLTGALLFLYARKFKYRKLLFVNALLAVAAPMLILLFPSRSVIHLVFLLGGIIYAFYSVSMNGVLLEVSGRSNRTLYTGIAGAGNILPALFPLLGGYIIKHWGFLPFLLLFSGLILLSLYFIRKLDCEK